MFLTAELVSRTSVMRWRNMMPTRRFLSFRRTSSALEIVSRISMSGRLVSSKPGVSIK